MMLRAALGSAVGCLLAMTIACGSTAGVDEPPGTFDGKVTGKTLVVHESVAVHFVRQGRPFGLLVFLGDVTNSCERLKQIVDWKDAVMEPKDPIVQGATSFWMLLLRGNPDGVIEDVTPGEYKSPAWFGTASTAPVPQDGGAPPAPQAPSLNLMAGFEEADNACIFLVNQSATSGTVHLDAISANGRAAGTFQILVGQQADRVSGSFDARICAELEFTTSGARPPGCP